MNLPGIITGQPISGQGFGQALFQWLPSLPFEGPPFMPRILAKTLFPRGFGPGMIAALPAELPQVPPVQPPIQLAPAVDVKGNQIQRRQPMPAAIPQPAPPKRVLERGTFPEWH